MEFFLNKTGRPILYSCSWPAYFVAYKKIVSHIQNIVSNPGVIHIDVFHHSKPWFAVMHKSLQL